MTVMILQSRKESSKIYIETKAKQKIRMLINLNRGFFLNTKKQRRNEKMHKLLHFNIKTKPKGSDNKHYQEVCRIPRELDDI